MIICYRLMNEIMIICYRLMNCCCRQLLDSILGLLLMWFLMQGLRTDYIAHVSLSWGEVSITVCKVGLLYW